jgi:rhodanese-related sulfurtransferase
MAITPQRISVKFFASPDPAAQLDATPVIGVFHRFIRDATLEGLLFDVADYRHVPNGPGVILIGHEVDYGIDSSDGYTGLLTLRKRFGQQALADVLRDTLRKAIAAVAAIEAHGGTGLRFSLDSFELQILDRLSAPNDAEHYAAAKAEVEPVIGELYQGLVCEIDSASERYGRDARTALSIVVHSPGAPDAKTLLDRLPEAPAALAQPAAAAPKQSDWDIEVEDLKRLREEGANFRLIDVRNPDEFDAANLGGELIPLDTLEAKLSELPVDDHYVVHCETGGRGAKAVKAMRGAGFTNSWNLNGGLRAWSAGIDPDATGS